MWGTRRFLDAEVEDWHIECWAWLLRHLGGLDAVRARRLALPTGEFFPQVQGEPHARALDVFARVKELMGMGEDWPCTLIPRERTTGAVGEFAVLKAAKGVAGTFFQTSSGDIVITYDRALVERPSNLIATFAHELSHYALKDIAEPPPGAEVEPMLRELATDLAAAFHGFALLSANAAFDFRQTQDFGRQGWQSSFSGYFSEDGWVFALAVFLALREEPADAAKRWLKPHLAKKLDAARKRLSDVPALLAPLRG